MRGFINTLVLAMKCHTGGAAGQSNSLLFICHCVPMAAPWRWDSTHTAHLQQLLGAGCTIPEVSCALTALSTGWIWCEQIQRTMETRRHSHLHFPDEIHRWFRLTGAETSIKTQRLSLNLSLALRKKQPLQELFFSPLLFSPHLRCSAWGLRRSRDRS